MIFRKLLATGPTSEIHYVVHYSYNSHYVLVSDNIAPIIITN